MDKFIEDLARKAGKILKDRFGKAHTVRIKTKGNATDVVTEADLAAEKLIVSAIKKKFPEHGIVAEEEHAYHEGQDYVWYIDPLDGTYNFTRGIPVFCVMIGLAYKGRMRQSIIFDPIHDWMYYAARGKGAYLNTTRITCGGQKTFQNSYGLYAGNISHQEKIIMMKRLLRQAQQEPFWMTGTGSAGISSGYVAQGACDWWVSLNGGPWDYAAGALILEEAGCVMQTKEGRPWKPGDTSLIVANKYLHPQLMRLVRGN